MGDRIKSVFMGSLFFYSMNLILCKIKSMTCIKVFHKYSRLHILGSCYIGIPGTLNYGYCSAFLIKLTTTRNRELSKNTALLE